METRDFRRIFSFSGQALFNHLVHIAGLVLERLSQREFEFICILGLCKIEACDFVCVLGLCKIKACEHGW
ncbi:unnamed protein product [Prunus brigantina]